MNTKTQLPAKYETPVRYLVIATSYINDRLINGSEPADDERGTAATANYVDYDGHPGTNLEPAEVSANGRSAAANMAEGKRRRDAYFASKGATADEVAHRTKVLTHGVNDHGMLSGGVQAAPAARLTAEDEQRLKDLDEREKSLADGEARMRELEAREKRLAERERVLAQAEREAKANPPPVHSGGSTAPQGLPPQGMGNAAAPGVSPAEDAEKKAEKPAAGQVKPADRRT